MAEIDGATSVANTPAYPPPASPAVPVTGGGAQQHDGSDGATVSDKAGEAAGQAKQKAQDLAGQGKSKAREQVDQRSTQAGERVQATGSDLRSVGEELRKQGKDGPAKLAESAAERTERLGSYLKESDSDRFLSDIEGLGRRQPLAVLAGGLVAGFVLSRFLKASSTSRYQDYQRGVPAPQPVPAGNSAHSVRFEPHE